MIPFEDPIQVGAFVFHCHILEHEDKGMMATVEVYDPARILANLARARTPVRTYRDLPERRRPELRRSAANRLKTTILHF